MSEKTKISWCNSTVNFWSGCTKVSPGCKHCYAEALSNRNQGPIGKWGKGAPRRVHESAFTLAVRLNRKPWVCDKCGKAWAMRGMHPDCGGESQDMHRRRIFSLSLGDWLDPEVPIEWLARMLNTVRRCNHVTWILCTMRPELWQERLTAVRDKLAGEPEGEIFDNHEDAELAAWVWYWRSGNKPRHVWILTSVENQAMADKRIPELLNIPAARRGLSCEPLLEPIDLTPFEPFCSRGGSDMEGIDWVIIGGESGRKSRPCDVEWIRSLNDQSRGAGVPVFVKQLGSAAVEPDPEHDFRPYPSTGKGSDPAEWPQELRVQQWPQEHE